MRYYIKTNTKYLLSDLNIKLIYRITTDAVLKLVISFEFNALFSLVILKIYDNFSNSTEDSLSSLVGIDTTVIEGDIIKHLEIFENNMQTKVCYNRGCE